MTHNDFAELWSLLRLWSPTRFVVNFVQEADALQMFRRGHRQGQHVTNGLVEARVGSIAEGHGLVFVLQEVLDMAHLMVYGDQVIHGHNGALFDPGDVNKDTVRSVFHLQKVTCNY